MEDKQSFSTNRPLQIAIDGPVGSGKGTIANLLRSKIGGSDIYTGGTYRAVALYCLQNNINLTDHSQIIDSLKNIHIDVDNDIIFLNGKNVTDEIKKNDVANATPLVASIREVRDAMIAIQRKAVEREKIRNRSIIIEGRDIGTNVLPDADFKIFLTADAGVRAKRRMDQLADFGENVNFEKVKQGVENRDRIDLERENDPLEKNPESKGYFVVDNTNQTEEQTIEVILKELTQRNLL